MNGESWAEKLCVTKFWRGERKSGHVKEGGRRDLGEFNVKFIARQDAIGQGACCLFVFRSFFGRIDLRITDAITANCETWVEICDVGLRKVVLF